MKRFIVIVLNLCFLLTFAGCARTNRVDAKINGASDSPISSIHTPPYLTINCHNKGERVTDWGLAQCPRYEWKPYGGPAVNADGLFVFDLWLTGELKCFDLSKVERVDFNFEVSPDRVTVTAWKAECATEDRSLVSESINLPVTENSFTIPSDGEYIYQIDAEWDEEDGAGGNATYVLATCNKNEEHGTIRSEKEDTE